MSLWENDAVSISDLAKKTGLTNATMTPLLKLLEKKGFVLRQRLEGNERQKNIVLTEAGRDLSSKSEEITQKAFCSAGLTEKQAFELSRYCKLISEKS